FACSPPPSRATSKTRTTACIACFKSKTCIKFVTLPRHLHTKFLRIGKEVSTFSGRHIIKLVFSPCFFHRLRSLLHCHLCQPLVLRLNKPRVVQCISESLL